MKYVRVLRGLKEICLILEFVYFDADMAKMAADPATQRWWDVVKPLMQPLEDRAEGEFWSDMEEIYHLD